MTHSAWERIAANWGTHGQEQVNAKQRRRLRCNLTFGIRIFNLSIFFDKPRDSKGERTV
jgi:hypothetical protein